MTFQHPTGRLYYHTEKIISVTIPTHFSCHSLCLLLPISMARSNLMLLSEAVIILFLDNKSSYKMVRISSHPLGSFSSPSNISHRKITQTRHIEKFMKKKYPDVSEFYQKCVMAFPGFVISPIWHFLILLPTITLMLRTGGRGKYANTHPVNPHRTCFPHVQSEILFN